MKLVFGLAGLALMGACAANPPPAPAPKAAPLAVAQPATAKPAAQPVAVANADKKTCRSVSVIGSLTPKKFCQTQAEWDAYDKKGLEGADALNEQRRQFGH